MSGAHNADGVDPAASHDQELSELAAAASDMSSLQRHSQSSHNYSHDNDDDDDDESGLSNATRELYYSSRELSSERVSSSQEILSGRQTSRNPQVPQSLQARQLAKKKKMHDKPLRRTRVLVNGSGSGGGGGGATTTTTNHSMKQQQQKAAQTGKGPPPPPPPPAFVRRSGTGRSRTQALILFLFIIGLIVCVSSLACLMLLPTFVNNQIAKKLVLKNNSMLLERWSKPNVPMYFKVWLFNVKNAQELIDKRETKPRIEEIGPFVFNLRRQKDVISFAGDNLYYTERRIYHFNETLSCCAINTTVTIPNIPLVAVVDRALSYNLPIVGRFIPRLINRAIQSLREQLFVRKQVREILFDGYDVELLRMVSRVGSLVGLPQQSQKFALLKGRNDTWRPEQDGVWAINTGLRDRKQFGRVSSWNSYKKLPFWAGAQCNVINGSDGTLFPPPIKRTEPLYIFNQELCRTVNLVYDRPVDVRSIQAYRFVLNPMNFAHTMVPGQQQSTGAANTGTGTGTGTGQAPSPASPLRLNPNIAFQTNPRLNPGASNQAPQPLNHAPVNVHSPPNGQLAGAPHSPGRHPASAQQSANNRGHDLRPAASEQTTASGGAHSLAPPAHPARFESSNANGGGGGGLAGRVPLRANLLQAQDGARHDADTTTLRQQEKLIKVAQEQQLAQDRRAESRINPQTCFCDRKQTNLNGVNVCEFDGLIDLSKCSKQAQVIFGSSPHFHNSDPRLARQVSGLEPNASRHTTYMFIEPNTGLVLGGKRRVQLNVIIKHNNEIDGFENIQDMLVPVVWFEESALISEETAQKFRSLYVDRVRLINWTLVSLLVASLVLLAVDTRLLLASHYWRNQFELATSGGGGSSANSFKPTHAAAAAAATTKRVSQQLSGEKVAKKLPGPLAKLVSCLSPQSAKADQLASPAHNRISSSSATSVTSGGGGGGGVALAAAATAAVGMRRQLGANSPLLKHNQSSASSSSKGGRSYTSTSSPTCYADDSYVSSSSSGGETPPDSPELRKWSPPSQVAAIGVVKAQGSHDKDDDDGATRIYLSATRRAQPEAADGATRK